MASSVEKFNLSALMRLSSTNELTLSTLPYSEEKLSLLESELEDDELDESSSDIIPNLNFYNLFKRFLGGFATVDLIGKFVKNIYTYT